MVKIRLLRQGSKHDAKFRIVAADARSPRDGKHIEVIGRWEPKTKKIDINKDLILKWLNFGAQPSETVKNLLKANKIWSEFMNSKPKKKLKKRRRNLSKSTASTKKTLKLKPKLTVSKSPIEKKIVAKKAVPTKKTLKVVPVKKVTPTKKILKAKLVKKTSKVKVTINKPVVKKKQTVKKVVSSKKS